MDHATITLVILAATIFLLVTELAPLSVTALLSCLSLVLTGVLTPARAFGQFASGNVMLFGSMFVIGYAVTACGLARDIGGLMGRFAGGEARLVLALLLVAGGMAALLGKTTAFAVCMPLVIGIAADAGYNRGKLLFTMMTAIGMGGCVTFLGGPSWLFTKSQIELAAPGAVVGMFEIAKVTLPMFAITVLYMMATGYRLIPERPPPADFEAAWEPDRQTPRRTRTEVAIIVAVAVLGIAFSNYLKIDAFIFALSGAVLLVLTRCITETEAYRSVSWKTLILFGGILPLSEALSETGAGAILAGAFIRLMGDTANPYVIVAVCLIVPCIVTQFLSNTTCITIFTPLGLSIALEAGANPMPVILAISIGSAISIATPIGQPGNTLVYGVSGLRFLDFVKVGLPLTVILVAYACVAIPLVWPLF